MGRALALLAVAALVAGGIVAGVALANGSAGNDTRARSTTSTAPTAAKGPGPTATTSTTSTASPTAPRAHQPVTFAFGGDVHFEGSLRTRAIADPSGLLAPIAPVLSSADVAVVNLETAVTERGTPASKQYVFRAPVAGLRALKAAGVDVATMANNHGEDYGPVGLADSLTASRETGFPVIGIGENAAAAYAPWRTVVRGERVSVIGATQVIDDSVLTAWTATDTHAGLASAKEVARLVAAVRDARATSDVVAVYVHWGVEGATCPTPLQRTLAQQLVDAGADVVVGSHSHRVEGGGRLGNAYVDYGLGNFVFYNESGASGVSGVLKLTVQGRQVTTATWTPAQIRSGVPRPLTGSAASAGVAQWNDRRPCTGLAP